VTLSRRNLLVSAVAAPVIAASDPTPPRLKIVVTGGHPGDPECGCAGTIARYVALGHDVTLLYLNRGEGFCKVDNSTAPDCAAIRTAEAQKACQILHARPIFASQIDGHAIVDNARYQEFSQLLAMQNPDILFTQWPIDNHRDHRAISQLVLDAWLASGKKAAFYYYEVADDTMMFSPADYVDISAPDVESLRRAACYAHASQQPDKWYPHQVELTRFRGSQCAHPQAEAFLRHWESRTALLP
jgi:LmbE family N-acetylglucosaminyl deacetylase